MLGPHLSKHVQQPDGASHLPTKDGGDHGVDATAAYPAMLRDANARQHRDEGHEDDEGHQEQAQEHTCVSLQQSGGGGIRFRRDFSLELFPAEALHASTHWVLHRGRGTAEEPGEKKRQVPPGSSPELRPARSFRQVESPPSNTNDFIPHVAKVKATQETLQLGWRGEMLRS